MEGDVRGYSGSGLDVPIVPGRPSSVGDVPLPNNRYQGGYIPPYPDHQPVVDLPSSSDSTRDDDRHPNPGRVWNDHQPSSSSYQNRLEHEESMYLAEQRKKQEIEWKDHEFAKQLASDQEREERELVARFERGMGVGTAGGAARMEGSAVGYPTPPPPPPPFVNPPEPRGYEGYTGQRHSMPSGSYSGSGSGSRVGTSTAMPDPKDYQRRRQELGSGGQGGMQPGQVYERYMGGYGHPPYPRSPHPYPQAPPQFQVPPHPYGHGRTHTPTPMPTSSAEERRHSTPTTARPRPPRSRGDRPLRPLHVPISLIPTFLRIASSHTQRGIEMCGLILGTIRPPSARRSKESRRHSRSGSGVSIAQSVLGHQEEEEGELVVQAVLIPRQEGTSDTCTMKEEERVVGVQLERGLIALGWVSVELGIRGRVVAGSQS